MTMIGLIHGSGDRGRGAAVWRAGAAWRCAAAFRRRAAIARAERGLLVLPDHVLRDMGLHRSEIPAVLRIARVGFCG